MEDENDVKVPLTGDDVHDSNDEEPCLNKQATVENEVDTALDTDGGSETNKTQTYAGLGSAEQELYRMKELVRELKADPHAMIEYVEKEGVCKLGEFDFADYLVLKAMGQGDILTCGTDHLDGLDWQAMWTQIMHSMGAVNNSGWAKLTKVEAHVVLIRDAAAQGKRGLLQPLLKLYQARACNVSVFGLPAVHAIVNFKWNTWARRYLLYELALYLTWLFSFTAFTLLYEYEDDSEGFEQFANTPLGIATLACNFLGFAAMLPFMYMEVCTIIAYNSGWFNFWNTLDIACYLLQIMISIIHVRRDLLDDDTFTVMLSVQHVLLWSKLHWFIRVLTPNKNLLLDTLRIVFADLGWFLVFMGLTMLGFAFAFYSLYRQERDVSYDFTNFWHAIASMFSYLLAMFDYNLFFAATNSVAIFALFIAYEVIMYIMLLNISIAVMTSSFHKITQDEGLRYLSSKAQIIDELEASLPNWIKCKQWYPTFVHFLKVHPVSTFEHTSLNNVMTGLGSLEANMVAAQQDVRMRMDACEAKIAEAHEKLATAAAMINKLLTSADANRHARNAEDDE